VIRLRYYISSLILLNKDIISLTKFIKL